MRLWIIAWVIVCFDIMLLASSFPLRSSLIPMTRKAGVGSCRSAEYSLLSNVIVVEGAVCKGYGRGSKQLGFPTANLPQFDKELTRHAVSRGIYFGWCNIGSDRETYPCVTNIGISPTFVGQENAVNIIESYVLNRAEEKGDFYDQQFRLALVGYIRPEMKFSGLDALISQINSDVEITREACARIMQSRNQDSAVIGVGGSAEQAAAAIVRRVLSAGSTELCTLMHTTAAPVYGTLTTDATTHAPSRVLAGTTASTAAQRGQENADGQMARLVFGTLPVVYASVPTASAVQG